MKLIINGKDKLMGVVKLAGAKNAATKMMVASLLTDEPSYLFNFPMIGDTKLTGELCTIVGSQLHHEGVASSDDSPQSILTIHTPTIKNFRVISQSRRNRIPILTAGPLLHRAGEAEIPILGGDRIGARPVDMHLTVLEKMGASIEQTDQGYYLKAPNGLSGITMELRYPSVGATETVLLSAVLAKGKTILRNAALEPEIIDLIKMLQKMGAVIAVAPNRIITIEGVSRLHGAMHEILPDRNEAVSFGVLALATDGKIFLKGASHEHLITFLNALRKIGGEYRVESNGILVWREFPLRPIDLETDTHPGFMTDWQQPFTILLTQAHGTSTIHETVYEDRFGYTKDLNAMGANISTATDCNSYSPCRFSEKQFRHYATILGPTPLVGRQLSMPDLRAGMAHVIASLIAEGQSVVDGIEELDRGYEKIDERLRSLGADIKRINNEPLATSG